MDVEVVCLLPKKRLKKFSEEAIIMGAAVEVNQVSMDFIHNTSYVLQLTRNEKKLTNKKMDTCHNH